MGKSLQFFRYYCRPALVLVNAILLLSLFCMTNADAAQTERFVFVREGNVWIANLKGGWERQLTYSARDRSPAISHDGEWVAYASGYDELTGYGQLYLVPARGGASKKFAIQGIQNGEYPSFSPDGQYILFVGLSNTKNVFDGEEESTIATVSICAIDLENLKYYVLKSKNEVNIDEGLPFGWPSYSPDGKYILYQDGEDDTATGFRVFDHARKATHLSQEGLGYLRPHYDPTGTTVLCFAQGEDNKAGAIYIVNPSKSSKKKIAEGKSPAYVNGGKAIVFEKYSLAAGKKVTDLWYLDLTNGMTPRKLVKNGLQPAGRPFSTWSNIP